MNDRTAVRGSAHWWRRPLPPARTAAIGLGFVVASGLLAGCGTETTPSAATTPSATPPSAAELASRARQAGVPVELIYVMDLEGYHRAAGGMGGYGADGFQDIYVAGGGDVRLTVERRTLTAATCRTVPIPAAEPPGGPVRCTPDGGGWRRISGDRQECALVRGDHLVRVSGRRDTTTLDMLRTAALDAHPASPEELDELLPPAPSGQATPVERGDLPRTGDGAPDNHVGPGG